MTVSQWLVLVQLGISLYKELNKDKITKSEKEFAVKSFCRGIVPILDDDLLDGFTKLVGSDLKNIPTIMNLIADVNEILSKKSTEMKQIELFD